ncbi:MAG: Stk1 family PASTA domain-containing Ser/Thr kinase [Oscillospiraceae bacterium]|nr:Stk1 family PASTA domain-containing Ser/Thr kinase [Oscillospiraceae bacterium]
MENDKYIGKLLDDRYEILEVIGNGGMAVVYKARCRRLNRMVAVKILKDEFSQDEDFRRRFHAESQAVAMLSHPNIVSVYDVSSSKESDYIVMELIDGISLKYYMEKKGVLNWKETLHFAIQIAKALEHAHSRGIVHRDIKPHNVMVLKNGSVKVADFGIAQIMSTANTMTQEALGSVHYISPEQAKGSRVDSRSDVYSLGIVMYEMISGRVPYDDETPVAVVMKHINGGAPLPTTLNPNTPKGLEQIIMKAMAQQPKDRYATATALLYDMDEFRKNPVMVFPERVAQVQPPVKPEPKGERSIAQKKVQPNRKPERRSRTTTIAIASCAVVGLIALIILIILLPSCQSGGGMVEVPKLVGLYYSDLPEYDGLQVVKTVGEASTEYPAGQIISQSPEPGEKVEKGTKIFVIVSLGSQSMPDVTDKPLEEATSILRGVKTTLLITPVKENSDTVAKGNVIRTEPEAGTVLTAGQEVKLYYSIGVETEYAIVPNVEGESLESAKKMLTEAGFSNFREELMDSKLPKDIVVGLSIKAGSMVDFKKENKLDVTQEIVIYVSRGIQLEDLSLMTKEEAATYLNDLDMDLVVVFMGEANEQIPFGDIIRTEPVAGEYIGQGDEVTVYFSAVTVIPDVRGKELEEAKQILEEAGFTNYREKETSSCLPKGTVVMLSDDPGVQADASKPLVIYVSKGDQGLKDLSGMTLEAAIKYINSLDLGLTVEQTEEKSDTVDAGQVIRTKPGAGDNVSFGQVITIYYSSGSDKVQVPDVEGDLLDTAIIKLESAGFKNWTVEEIDSEGAAGTVVALSVTAGEQVPADQTITIYVARGNSEKKVALAIPSRGETVLVTILCDGEKVLEQYVDSATEIVYVTLSGSGTKTCKIYFDSTLVGEETVELDPNE